MTKSDWLTVAMIAAVIMTAAATLLGPPLAVFVQLKMSQPRPHPEPSKQIPKGPFQRIRSFMDFKRLWISWVGFYLCGLVSSLGFQLGGNIINRYTVMMMAFGVAGCLYFAMGIVVIKMFDELHVTSNVQQ